MRGEDPSSLPAFPAATGVSLPMKGSAAPVVCVGMDFQTPGSWLVTTPKDLKMSLRNVGGTVIGQAMVSFLGEGLCVSLSQR